MPPPSYTPQMRQACAQIAEDLARFEPSAVVRAAEEGDGDPELLQRLRWATAS